MSKNVDLSQRKRTQDEIYHMENPMLTGSADRQIIRLALPLLCGNILQQGYGVVDSMMIGRFLGLDAFAAAGVAATVMNLMIFVLNGFCTGLSVIFASLYGADDKRKFRQEVFVALSCGGILALLIGAVFFAGAGIGLQVIGTPQNLIGYGSAYLRVIAGGLLITYAYNLFSAILQAVGDTRASLGFLMVAAIGNIALDYLLIVVIPLGICGAGLATVLSQSFAALGCFFYLRSRYPQMWFTRREVGIHRELIQRTMRFGFAGSLQASSLYLGKIFVQGAVNQLGTVGIAGFAGASRLEGFANSFADSGAISMSVIISQNYGAGKRERVKELLRKGLHLHLGVGLAVSAALFCSANLGMRLFLDQSEQAALIQGSSYLHVVAVFYLLCFIGSCMVGYFRGVGAVQVPVMGTMINITIRVLLSYPLIRQFGLRGLGLATAAGWCGVLGCQLFWKQKEK